MTETLGTYSDWRTIAPSDRCPQCGSTHLRSRDCPTGLELECIGSCGYREVLTPEKFTTEDFDRWMATRRSRGAIRNSTDQSIDLI